MVTFRNGDSLSAVASIFCASINSAGEACEGKIAGGVRGKLPGRPADAQAAQAALVAQTAQAAQAAQEARAAEEAQAAAAAEESAKGQERADMMQRAAEEEGTKQEARRTREAAESAAAQATREAQRKIRRLKAANPFATIVVTGCAAQVDTEEFRSIQELI